MSEEAPRSVADDARKHLQAQRQLVLDYKALFNGDRGARVLADLKKCFRFDKWEAEDSEDANVIARRVCMKGPIFHIEKMLRTTFREHATKPKRALSGSHHEPAAPPA